MSDLHRLSIRELSEGLAQAKFSSRELTEHYLKRIAKIDTQVQSYITVTAEQALAQAEKTGVLGILMGMFDLTAAGIVSAIIFSFIFTLIFKPRN